MLFIIRILIFIVFVALFVAFAVLLTGLLGNNLKKSKNPEKMQAYKKNAR